MKIVSIFYFLIVAFLLTGCASSRSSEVYTREQARQAQTVQLGIVEFVKTVRIEGTKSGLGTIAGGVTGGVAGSTIGSGTGSSLASIAGALAGAFVGSAAEEKLTGKTGLEITVKLDSGNAIAVTQEADIPFTVGDRVRVLTSPDGTTRVSK